MTNHQEDTAKELQDQPIWVQDLLAWLDKLQQQNLRWEEWVKRVEEVLAELPGQGLPDKFAEIQDAAEPQPLNEQEKVRIQKELDTAKQIEDERERAEALAAVAAEIPANEPQLLQDALEDAKGIDEEDIFAEQYE